MVKKKSYDEVSVIRSLSKKASIRINTVQKVIEIAKNNNDVGNGSWGKIDYLHKVHGYIYVFVDSLGNKKINKVTQDGDDNAISSKAAKREAKFNMATMAKAAMRKAKTK